jgi:superfamily I DNA/RNA helicase
MDVSDELREAVERVLLSKSPKKLIVAGPGSGKTTLFQKLLERTDGNREQRLVLTFINNLKTDLERSLGSFARVHTLHGYCQSLLHGGAQLRQGLSANFVCYPGLISIIKKDWEWLRGQEAPSFVDKMRDLSLPLEHQEFYLQRSSYYDAVDFDDSVYRVFKSLDTNNALVPIYNLVLIDEFQDFNKMESGLIDLLSAPSPIVIAGDDDQALYAQLRGADWAHIRKHYFGGEYEVFELPFCMRCPEVVVAAVNDVIVTASRLKKLVGRIAKPFRFFEPVKGKDSIRFPKIEIVSASVQRAKANYFGQYLAQFIQALPEDELKLASEKHEPAVLIIGSKPYMPQVEDYLVGHGLLTVVADDDLSERERALEILRDNPHSNLGWRIILEELDVNIGRTAVKAADEMKTRLCDQIDEETRAAVLLEANEFSNATEMKANETSSETATNPIKLTSYEGSKGLSAQYVFLLGLHEGDLPKNAAAPRDIEICKFLVGLTRTKKKCTIMIAKNFAGQPKKPSSFLGWIKSSRFETVKVDAAYWKEKKP